MKPLTISPHPNQKLSDDRRHSPLPFGSRWFRRIPLWLVAGCLIATPLWISGCRTAASVGLPVASGSHVLLPYVAEARETTGHRKNVPTELAKSPLLPHRVEAGDVLVIEPNDFNSPVRLQSDQTVQQDGTIDLGDYGQVQIAGLTTNEIQQLVHHRVATREIEKHQTRVALASHRDSTSAAPNPNDFGLSVRLVNKESGMIYVMGEVNAPGSYPLVGSETVLDALIAAGGLSDRCNEHNIVLTRPQLDGQPRIILPVCYQQILQLGDVSTNYQLMPGDRIYVPSLTMWQDLKQSMAVGSNQSCPHCRKYK